MAQETFTLKLRDTRTDLRSNAANYTVNLPDPPAARPTVFGAAVRSYPGSGRTWQQEITAHQTDCGAPMGCLRSYDSGMPTSWTTRSASDSHIPASAPGWETRESWHSFKAPLTTPLPTLRTWIRGYLATVPPKVRPDGTVVIRRFTLNHEPAVKQLDPVGWENLAYHFALYVREWREENGRDDIQVGPCMDSRYYIAPPAPRIREEAYLSERLGAVSDFMGADPYNEHSWQAKYTEPYQDPAYYLQGLMDLFARYSDAPFAVGETGYVTNPEDLAMKPTWLTRLGNFAIANGFAAVCVFDASLLPEKTDAKPWWLRLNGLNPGGADLASARAWGAFYL